MTSSDNKLIETEIMIYVHHQMNFLWLWYRNPAVFYCFHLCRSKPCVQYFVALSEQIYTYMTRPSSKYDYGYIWLSLLSFYIHEDDKGAECDYNGNSLTDWINVQLGDVVFGVMVVIVKVVCRKIRMIRTQYYTKNNWNTRVSWDLESMHLSF